VCVLSNSTCFLLTKLAWMGAWPRGHVAIPIIYNARSLRLTVHRECLTRSSNTRAFSQLFLRVLFITTMTLAVNNDDSSNWGWSCDVFVCVKYAIWLFCIWSHSTYLHYTNFDFWLLLVLITFWEMIRCSLQLKTNKKPCCGKETARCRCKIRYASKFTAAWRGPPCDSTPFMLDQELITYSYTSCYSSCASPIGATLFKKSPSLCRFKQIAI